MIKSSEVSKINNDRKSPNWPLLIFVLFSFVILPAVAFPLLISSKQMDRFGYILAGYWAIATQVIALGLKEAMIWKLRLFDYENSGNTKKTIGKWINIFMLAVSIPFLFFGIYHAITYQVR